MLSTGPNPMEAPNKARQPKCPRLSFADLPPKTGKFKGGKWGIELQRPYLAYLNFQYPPLTITLLANGPLSVKWEVW